MSPSRAATAGIVLGLVSGLGLVACGGGPDADLALHRATNAVAQDRFDWARIYFREDFEQHPERLSSLRSEGRAWLSGYQRSLSSGVDAYLAYLEQRPDDADVALHLVQSLLLLGRWDDARAQLDKLDGRPAAELARAEALGDADPAGARAALVRALARAPEDPAALAALAEIEASAGALEAARQHAEGSVRHDPFVSTTWYLLARLQRQSGDPEEARATLAVHEIVRRLAHDGTMARASPVDELALLRQLGAHVPTDGIRFRYREVELLYRAGEIAEAGPKAEALAALPGVTLSDRLQLATWAGDAGSRALSRDLFEALLAEHPGTTGAVASLALLDLEAGDLASARARLEGGLASDPHFARYHHYLARVAEAEDAVAEALEHHREAVRLAPWEVGWRLASADLLRLTGDTEGLRQVLAEAPEPNPRLDAFRARWSAVLGPS